MMKSMAKGGAPQIPGMAPGLAAANYGGEKRAKGAPKKVKGKCGNPAKRAQQEAEAARRARPRERRGSRRCRAAPSGSPTPGGADARSFPSCPASSAADER